MSQALWAHAGARHAAGGAVCVEGQDLAQLQRPGTDGRKPPAARTYVIKQSRRPIRGGRGFARAQTLCRGRCRFNLTLVGAKATLTVRDLRPNTTYYYSVAALDNVSARRGPASPTTKARTRR